MKNSKKQKNRRGNNPVAVAMMKRYGTTGTVYRHRNDRRRGDARNDHVRVELSNLGGDED